MAVQIGKKIVGYKVTEKDETSETTQTSAAEPAGAGSDD